MQRKYAILVFLGLLGTAGVLTAANTPGMSLARGYIFRGNSSGVGAPYDANNSGQILVGDGTDLVSVAVGGDITLAANGTVTMAANSIVTGDITDATITADDLATSSVGTLEIAANVVVSADIDQNVIQVDNTQLTNTNMLALRATPIELIAAPAANTSILVHKVCVVLDAAAGAYTESSDDLAIEFAASTDVVMVDMTDGFDDAAVTSRCYVPTYESQILPLNAAGTACNTTCGGLSCMVGIDSDGNANGTTFVACDSVAADGCLCRGYLAPVAATKIQAINTGNGEWGGGNAANTLSIRIWYSLVPTIAFSTGG